ncbi:lauroyl acyltransferase [uncultured Tateyamaria sp.]|uniref:lysophospholipid acyltransferase family protein n=1 Tax=uncultured Tateyamaria sp. TaxID=455651 RepID=UPI00260F4000|nr:lauroyl acyltransferase [uncultured Tateyamaria sp.]
MRYALEDMPTRIKAQHRVVNLFARVLLGGLLVLPYRWRVPAMGWIMARIIGPAVGYMRRAEQHVRYIMPHLPDAEITRIARASLDNAGRTLIEIYSTSKFHDRQRGLEYEGPGFAAFEEAAKTGQPVILAGGHFGNYEASRANLVDRGYEVSGLYRDMSNPFFNAHYVAAMETLNGPGFAQGRKGTAGFVRHLKAGGQLVLLFDQHVADTPVLEFLGKPACTAISAGELALRYNALLIPYYAIRNPDGLTFSFEMEAPVPHTDPLTMTQALNDSLSARIRANPEQWLWTARRWRPDEKV